MIGNEGLTSHGTQKNLIGYCYDSNLIGPNDSCGTDNIFINAVIDSNLELARRYNSNGLNIAKGPKGFSIVVTGYKRPKIIPRVSRKHEKPSVARMQTQWAAGNHKEEKSEETTTNRYSHVLFPNIPKLFDVSSSMDVDKPEKGGIDWNELGIDDNIELQQRKTDNPLVSHNGNNDEAESNGCSQNEFMCQVTEFSHRESTMHSNRCIWKVLKCDSHQNCGFTYNNDEINCSIDEGGSNVDEGETNHGGLNGNSINPWSISTMSLLIIIYLAIVLILVLVTMLLLRWHRALRTPLDVLSDR